MAFILRKLDVGANMQRFVSLTFDDCPNLFTSLLLEVLDCYDVASEFFGRRAGEKHQEIVKQIL